MLNLRLEASLGYIRLISNTQIKKIIITETTTLKKSECTLMTLIGNNINTETKGGKKNLKTDEL